MDHGCAAVVADNIISIKVFYVQLQQGAGGPASRRLWVVFVGATFFVFKKKNTLVFLKKNCGRVLGLGVLQYDVRSYWTDAATYD